MARFGHIRPISRHVLQQQQDWGYDHDVHEDYVGDSHLLDDHHNVRDSAICDHSLACQARCEASHDRPSRDRETAIENVHYTAVVILHCHNSGYADHLASQTGYPRLDQQRMDSAAMAYLAEGLVQHRPLQRLSFGSRRVSCQMEHLDRPVP